MNTDAIIKRVMANTPMPESLSTYQAFKQFENELSQHYSSEITRLQSALKVAEESLKDTTHYTECYADKWPTSGARQVGEEARTALAEIAKIREGA
jgi:hypothetical protein